MGKLIVLDGILIVFGLTTIFFGIIELVKLVNFMRKAKWTSGKITQMIERYDSEASGVYDPTVSFLDDRGQEISAKISNPTLNRYKLKQSVTVAYNPVNPKEALVRGIDMWLGSCILISVGVILFCAVFLASK